MKELHFYELSERLSYALNHGGAFLTSQFAKGKANTMTIGWATMGDSWGRPVFMAMVRKTRYTNAILKQNGVYTISIPAKGELLPALQICGSSSGMEIDKFMQAELSPMPGRMVDCPVIAQCDAHIECRILYSQEMNDQHIDPTVATSYADGDFHILYFAEILTCYES